MVGHSMIDVVVEMPARGIFVVHENTHESMKKLAAGEEPIVKIYPKATNIREYRSKEAEQFIEAKKDFNPVARPEPVQRESKYSTVITHPRNTERSDVESYAVSKLVGKSKLPASELKAGDSKKYPMLSKKTTYSKDELNSMPQPDIEKLQKELLLKKKAEGNLPKSQSQLLDRVNSTLEKRAEQGQARIRQHEARYSSPKALNSHQEQEVESLLQTLQNLEQERQIKAAEKLV